MVALEYRIASCDIVMIEVKASFISWVFNTESMGLKTPKRRRILGLDQQVKKGKKAWEK